MTDTSNPLDDATLDREDIPPSDLQALFADLLTAAGGTAWWSSEERASLAVLEAVERFGQPLTYTNALAALLPSLPDELKQAGLDTLPARTLEDALNCPVALSTAELAIAETGTVITAERELWERAPGMLSVANIIFLPAARLVAGLDEAAQWLTEQVSRHPYVSFISGPSRTADIERTLTIGVQGPRSLTVVFLRGQEE